MKYDSIKPISLNYHQEITDLCRPLQKLNITYFSHAQIEKSGYFTGLSNNPHFTEHYFSNKYYDVDIHRADKKFENFVVWDLLERRGLSDKMHREASHFGVRHTFTVIDKGSEVDNYYHFATHLSSNSINQVYLTNYDLIKLFISHFTNSINNSKDLLAIYDQKFKINKKGIYDLNTTHRVLLPNTRQEFIQEIGNNDFTASKINKVNLGISKRETEIITYLVKGLTAKNIASQLNISPRTVEHHIENIKTKLGVSTKTELIKLALDIQQIKV